MGALIRRLSSVRRSPSSELPEPPSSPLTSSWPCSDLPQLLSTPSDSQFSTQIVSRPLIVAENQVPDLFPQRFVQRHRTRWPTCIVSDSAFGPGGSNALLEALGTSDCKSVYEKELADFNQIRARAWDIGKGESVDKRSSAEDMPEMVDKNLWNQTVGGDNFEEMSAIQATIDISKTSRNTQEEVEFDEVDPIAGKIALDKERGAWRDDREDPEFEEVDSLAGKRTLERGNKIFLQHKERKHHCICDGHLFVKPNPPAVQGKTKNRIEEEQITCEVCCHGLMEFESFVCEVKACGIMACGKCVRRLEDDKRNRAQRSWSSG